MDELEGICTYSLWAQIQILKIYGAKRTQRHILSLVDSSSDNRRRHGEKAGNIRECLVLHYCWTALRHKRPGISSDEVLVIQLSGNTYPISVVRSFSWLEDNDRSISIRVSVSDTWVLHRTTSRRWSARERSLRTGAENSAAEIIPVRLMLFCNSINVHGVF